MSDINIKVGDLVVIVKSFAGNEGKIGIAVKMAPRAVDGFSPLRGPRMWVEFSRPITTGLGEPFNPAPVPISWLRRIPPLSELDEIERKEELPA